MRGVLGLDLRADELLDCLIRFRHELRISRVSRQLTGPRLTSTEFFFSSTALALAHLAFWPSTISLAA